jgi:oligopeptide/dipeptide ABC transporter ATP-binding protein
MNERTGGLLEIDALQIAAETRARATPVVRSVSLSVSEGETVCIVGETGSGKSMTMLAVMGLLPSPPMQVVSGAIRLNGRNLLELNEEQLRQIRGREIAMVYQDPMTSLNPLMRVGDQITEALRAHGVNRSDATARTFELLDKVGVADPPRSARSFPHEFSGGMRQRVMIAIALALSPRLLIADEPTTALDATIQQQIIALVRQMQEESGMTVVWITHDLGVVARLAQKVIVMYCGEVVEVGSVRRIFEAPEHPYTKGLLASLPGVTEGGRRAPLAQIPGSPPGLESLPAGCAFAPRCEFAFARCQEEAPVLEPRLDGAAACWLPQLAKSK